MKENKTQKPEYRIAIQFLSGHTIYSSETYKTEKQATNAIGKMITDKQKWIFEKNGYVNMEHVASMIVIPWMKQTTPEMEQAAEKMGKMIIKQINKKEQEQKEYNQRPTYV